MESELKSKSRFCCKPIIKVFYFDNHHRDQAFTNGSDIKRDIYSAYVKKLR